MESDKARELTALKLAAVAILDDSEVDTYDPRVKVFELLFQTSSIIKRAMDDGMTSSQIREHLKDGVTDEEYKYGRFLDDDEVCSDCGEFCDHSERCDICQEIFEEANCQ